MSFRHDWIDETDSAFYADALTNEYHNHRLRVIRALIPEDLFCPGRRIIDFGCGEGVIAREFLTRGCVVDGIDISAELVQIGKSNFRTTGLNEDCLRVGGVDSLRDHADASVDAVFCFNVLAYMDQSETVRFYEACKRIVRPGGWFIATHSNELFDLFSFNGYTLGFLKKHLVHSDFHDALDAVWPDHEKSRPGRNTAVVPATYAFHNRENPLIYGLKLQRYGFSEVQQEFINYHAAPPRLLAQDDYVETLGWPVEERWKLMFKCSTYGNRSIRNCMPATEDSLGAAP